MAEGEDVSQTLVQVAEQTATGGAPTSINQQITQVALQVAANTGVESSEIEQVLQQVAIQSASSGGV